MVEIELTREEQDRWAKKYRINILHSKFRGGEGYGLASKHRDPNDVRTIVEILVRIKPHFLYKNVSCKMKLRKWTGVCTLNALIEDGFVEVVGLRNNARHYVRLFDKEQAEHVIQVVSRP